MKHEANFNLPGIDAGWFDLRPVSGADQNVIEHVTSDKRVAHMTPKIPHPLPEGAAAELVARALAEDCPENVWTMDGQRSGGAEIMGLITLERIDEAQSEVSYWVTPDFWNKGVAQSAVHALINANPLDNRTLFASVFQENLASAKVLTKCGFAYLGDAEIHCVSRDISVPTWTYLKKLK